MFGNGKKDDLQERAEDLVTEASESLRDLGRSARVTAEDVKKDAVRRLNEAAHTLRREARQRGAGKDVQAGVDDVARGLERAAHYLKRHSFEDMGDDVVATVRRNPWRTLAVAFVLGIIIGLALRGDDRDKR